MSCLYANKNNIYPWTAWTGLTRERLFLCETLNAGIPCLSRPLLLDSPAGSVEPGHTIRRGTEELPCSPRGEKCRRQSKKLQEGRCQGRGKKKKNLGQHAATTTCSWFSKSLAVLHDLGRHLPPTMGERQAGNRQDLLQAAGHDDDSGNHGRAAPLTLRAQKGSKRGKRVQAAGPLAQFLELTAIDGARLLQVR